MSLETTHLAAAIAQVRESLAFSRSDMAVADERLYRQFRSAGIQSFEYTWEIATKLLRRAIEEKLSHTAVDAMSYLELIRAGVEAGLLRDASPWFRFRDLRNKTAHTYNSSTAEQVFAVVPEFLEQVEYFNERLTARNTGSL